MEFSRSKGFAIVSASNPSSPAKKLSNTEEGRFVSDVSSLRTPSRAHANFFSKMFRFSIYCSDRTSTIPLP